MIEVLLTSSVLILALALLRRGLRGRIDPRLQYALWLLVVLRLLIPGSLFPAPLTVSGALSDWEASRAADDTVPASAADAPAQSPAAGASSQPTGADVTALPVLGPLYDVYTEEKDFPLGTSPNQWLQEAPGEDYTVNGVEVCRGGGAHRDRSEVDMTPRETLIEVDLGAGSASADIWTNDLTHDYVEENSAYSS